MSGWLFAFAGVAAGAGQAALLGWALRRRLGTSGLLARVGLVAALLVLAASAGYLIQAAAGWLAGFASAAAIVRRRLG